MNTCDKNVRICFRCDDKLADWVLSQSQLLGLTPSAFVRQSLFGMMSSQLRVLSIMEKSVATEVSQIIGAEKAVIDEHNPSHQ